MIKTTVAEQGFLIPVGVEAVHGQAGARGREFAFRPWRGKDERAIGAILDDAKGQPLAMQTSHVLAYFLTQWAGEVLPEDMSHDQRLMRLSQAWAGDVYYAWFQLRRLVLGDEFTMQIKCPVKRLDFPYTVELGSVDVLVYEDKDLLVVPVQLQDGIPWAGKDRKVATLELLRWGAYETLKINETGQFNQGDAKLNLAQGCITGLDGVDAGVRIPDSVMDEISKRDLEALIHGFVKQPGPELLMSIPCPHCHGTHNRSVNWAYDSFFSATGVGGSGAGQPSTSGDQTSLRSATRPRGSHSR